MFEVPKEVHMRKALITLVLATLFVGAFSAPAGARPAGKSAALPYDYWFTAENPCVAEGVGTHAVGEIQVQALPSIEAFFADEWTHLTLKWVGRFETEDGYATPLRHFATQVVNDSGDPAHLVINEVDNIVFTNEATGGKYKVSIRFHLTLVDGQMKSFMDTFDARCIQQPSS
jgi:hypothetical protein